MTMGPIQKHRGAGERSRTMTGLGQDDDMHFCVTLLSPRSLRLNVFFAFSRF